jgi:hypothetical protein
MKGSTANVDRQLVLSLAQIDDVPEQTIRRPLDVADLDDPLGPHSMDSAQYER